MKFPASDQREENCRRASKTKPFFRMIAAVTTLSQFIVSEDAHDSLVLLFRNLTEAEENTVFKSRTVARC